MGKLLYFFERKNNRKLAFGADCDTDCGKELDAATGYFPRLTSYNLFSRKYVTNLNKIPAIMVNRPKNTMLMIKTVLAFLIVVFTTFCTLASIYSVNVNNALADNLIRLHVIANSNSFTDQTIKIDVRDAILKYTGDKIKDSKDVVHTRELLKHYLPEIIRTAKACINKKGYNYDVQAMVGSYPFPTKAYGEIILPAGSYQALRIVIGNGAGENWWCVLFPPFCLTSPAGAKLSEEGLKLLEDNLDEEEYRLITAVSGAGKGSLKNETTYNEIPYVIKFKIVELFEQYKFRVIGLFGHFRKLW
ncbi:MAG: stage II sporulation protein R [Clostridiales bacterium]|nr:stage II sporulation protein R [Clostridiales bacterium]